MSWEYLKYQAECKNCGKQGFCIRGSDDWNRTSTTWEGFDNQEPDPTAVARKRADRRDLSAICRCGNSQITVGELVENL